MPQITEIYRLYSYMTEYIGFVSKCGSAVQHYFEKNTDLACIS